MILKCFKYNQYFVAMMNIINLARIKNIDGKFEKHHIIPRCFYKINKLDIDNSANNLVNLTVEEHRKVHQLLPLCANDEIATRLNRCKGLMNSTRWTGGHIDNVWKENISKAIKGKKHTFKDPDAISKIRSELAKKRINSNGGRWGYGIPGHPPTKGTKGMHWWTDGINNLLANECPEGFHKGRVK